MVEEGTSIDYESEEEVDTKSHNKLLNAVSRLYKKQRVEAPKRREPAINVSEFHLANNADSGNAERVGVRDLLKALDGKGAPRKIQDKFQSLESKAVKLPPPIEKIHSDKIVRSVGYSNLKSHVSRWNGVVEKNRSAEQLIFPIPKESEIEVYRPMDFLNKFKNPTELELNLKEALQNSDVAKQEEKIEEAIFDLSIPEMIKQRKLMGKLKAQESYKIIKAIKQNKIKSKTYRRVLRKERAKKELKDFELLQKTNPEAALEKLVRLEKERAEERASLRHRNTGKWARGQAIRAKYNREARSQLAEQIAKSRELTQKNRLQNDSSSEGEEEEEEEDVTQNVKEDSDNPWMKVDNQTHDDFVEGYKKYWKNKNKQTAAVEQSINKQALAKLTDTLGPNPVNPERACEDIVELEKSNKQNHPSKSVNLSESCDKVVEINVTKETEPVIMEPDTQSSPKSSLEANFIEPQPMKSTKASNRKRKLKKVKKRETYSLSNSSGSWEVSSDSAVNIDDELHSEPDFTKKSISEIFNKVDDVMQKRIKERLEKLEKGLQDDESEEAEFSEDTGTVKDIPSDHRVSKRRKEAGMNEDSLPQDKGSEQVRNFVQVATLPDVCETGNATRKEINPNKFMNVKPRVLNAEIPDVIAGVEEALDDDEEDGMANHEKQRANLIEAFADDDVVEEFNKEKENDIKESSLQDIDLTLPGWGHWGGQSIAIKRRLIKAPKVKRKDSNRPNVIINDVIPPKLKEKMVKDIPAPFKSASDYEASIRAPIGTTWVPQTAFEKLTQSAVVRKMGAIITPITEDQIDLARKDKDKRLKINYFDSNKKTKEKIMCS